jgi:hypothetical protein
MKLHTAKRIYTTKISTLMLRPILDESQPFEFMQRMTDAEVSVFLSEVRNQLKIEGITVQNIDYYNKIYNALLKDREEVYQVIKRCGHDGNFDYEKDSRKFINFRDFHKNPSRKGYLYIWEKQHN